MSQKADIKAGFYEIPPKVNELRRIKRVLLSRKVVVVGLFIILLFTTVAIFAPWIAPYDPYQISEKDALLSPSWNHLLGTDTLGRDTLSRVIFGTRTSLSIAIVAMGLAATVGMVLGLVAGYFAGATSTIIMRFIDALMSFPMLLLALSIGALLGGGLKNVIIAIGVGLMSTYARVMWGQVMTIKQNDYILAQRSQGASNLRIMFLHILPNCFPVLIVIIMLQMGGAILIEAGLSFLGIGIAPPGASWGSMISNGYKYITTCPMLSFAPGIAIMLLVFAFNMVGDGIRDALDPRLRGKV
jgi:peptide/nickel transport system permease protein